MGDIYLPPGLNEMSWLVGGQPWPKDSETGLFAVAKAWKAAAARLVGDFLGQAESVITGIEKAYTSGPGHDALVATLNSLIDPSGDYSIQGTADSMKSLGQSADDAGDQVQAYKIQVLVGLAWLAYDLATAWLAGPAAEAVIAEDTIATRAAIDVARDIAVKAIKSAAVEGGTDAAIQLAQMAAGHRQRPSTRC